MYRIGGLKGTRPYHVCSSAFVKKNKLIEQPCFTFRTGETDGGISLIFKNIKNPNIHLTSDKF